MIEIIAILIAGIAIGRLFMHSKITTRIAGAMGITVWVLIFALGMSIGSNPAVVEQIPHIGLEALTIAALATGGSMAAVALTAKYIRKNSRK
ncbi:MAG: LysO family transporter [Muribaculaceae bacterium]|jgi:uncharacterized membrane protein YbjE (DUF340 family)|nr:LysO family transporter [Muribaculaceae bacterium]